ncbi:MAG: PAS domain S-box protein [Candidatus Harrisonbacteria bacterium]|nr:PAS domain S-box protein [Candidatus Harrisonbacteria bacterium]
MFKKLMGWLIDIIFVGGRKRRFINSVIFLAIIAPTIGFGLFHYLQAYRDLTKSAIDRRASLAHLSAITLRERFDRLVDVGISLATRVRLRQLIEEDNWSEAIKIMSSVPVDLGYIDRIVLVDPKGTVTADLIEPSDVIGKNFAFRDWYQGVSKKWEPYISEVFKGAAAPYLNGIVAAIPIKTASREIIGILVLQVSADRFFEWSKGIDVGLSSYVYFVDQKGHVVAHPKFPAQEGIIDFSNFSFAQRVLAGKRGMETVFVSVENEEDLIFYEPVPKYGWGAIIDQPTSAAFAVRDNNLRMILIVYSLIISLNCFLAYLILRLFNTISEYSQKQKVFLESIGDGVVAIDRYWNITLWNKAATEISGWSKEEVLGKPFRNFLKFIRERDRSENIAFIEEAMLFGRKGLMENNTLLIKKDDKEVPVGDSASPIFDQNQKVMGAIIIFRDISQERESQRLHSDFAYASHQFRTPVTKALWNLETASETKDFKIQKENIQNAYSAIQSINKLANHLLEISEIDQAQIFPKIEGVRFSDLFAALLKQLEKGIRKKGMVITPPAVSKEVSIITDPALLKKVLSEVLENAIEYSPNNSEVNISVASQENNILIKIQDFGIGIPKDQQQLIFTKFFRGKNIPLDSAGGGSGLYIAREYLKLLKGKIWFESEENIGTTFSILLPIQ